MKIVDGYTESGRHVEVHGDSRGGYGKYSVLVDDEQLTTTGIRVLRDGGSTAVTLVGLDAEHKLFFPNRIGDPDHRPRFDGRLINEHCSESSEENPCRHYERSGDMSEGMRAMIEAIPDETLGEVMENFHKPECKREDQNRDLNREVAKMRPTTGSSATVREFAEAMTRAGIK